MNRIKQLREELGMTQPELGKILNVQGAAMSKYENEKIPLTSDTIKTLAEFFGVSTDYLLCKSDDKLDIPAETNSSTSSSKDKSTGHGFFFFFFDDALKDTFVERINEVLKERNMSQDDLCNQVSFDSDECKGYLTGESEPSIKNIVELSQILDTSVDYLLGQAEPLTPTEKKMLNTFNSLNEDNQDIIIGKMKELLREQRLSNDNNLKKASGK